MPGKSLERDEWYVKTARDVAHFLGISPTTLSQQAYWRATSKTERGYYLPDIVRRRHLQTLRDPKALKDLSVAAAADPNSLEKLKKLEVAENVRRKKRENDMADSELLPRDEVERQLIDWAVRFRTPLLRLGDQIASRVPGSMKSAVKSEVEGLVVAALQMIVDAKHTKKTIAQLVLAEADRLRAKRNGKHNHKDA